MKNLNGNVIMIQHVVHAVIEAENMAIHRLNHKREDAFQLSDQMFCKMFRLDKELVRQLIGMVSPFMPLPSRSSALTVTTQVLVALRFFATGSYQEIIGSNLFTAVSQATVSRSISAVIDVLNRPEIFGEWVQFPRNLQDIRALRNSFYDKFQFPGVIGIIDCTHIAIVRPYGEQYPEHVYVNRKNYHSINVQLICDHNLKIMNVNSRFPGSCHDSYIWNQSNISRTMENTYRNNNNDIFYLLGDSGYPLRPWLLTPLREPSNIREERFNDAFRSVRSNIERCNGLLKNRFRCLLKHRALHYTPQVASKIVNACVVLHNMCIVANTPEPDIQEMIYDDGLEVEGRNVDELMNGVNPDLVVARQLLQRIIHTNF